MLVIPKCRLCQKKANCGIKEGLRKQLALAALGNTRLVYNCKKYISNYSVGTSVKFDYWYDEYNLFSDSYSGKLLKGTIVEIIKQGYYKIELKGYQLEKAQESPRLNKNLIEEIVNHKPVNAFGLCEGETRYCVIIKESYIRGILEHEVLI